MKCDSYYLQATKKLSPISMELYDTEEGHCLATKECECCDCYGDTDKCTFYPEKRKKKMTTAEMWLEAQKNSSNWYNIDGIYYNVRYGFIDLITMHPWPTTAFANCERFMKLNGWAKVDKPIMTKMEAENKFGIQIVG